MAALPTLTMIIIICIALALDKWWVCSGFISDSEHLCVLANYENREGYLERQDAGVIFLKLYSLTIVFMAHS